MGTVLSTILPNNTGRTDDPDPVTGLTSRDKYLVVTSWAKFMKNAADNGVALLVLFLEKYPQYIHLFPFKDVPQSEFKTNVRCRAHANRVVYGLASFVDSFNDNDLLIQLLTKTGTSHASKQVTAEGFIHGKEAIIELFTTLFKSDEIEAWNKALNVAFDVIIKGLKSEEAGNSS